MLQKAGVTLLLLDLDNTLAPYSRPTPTVALRNWVDALKKAGIEPFILSNNRGRRPRVFAEALTLDYMNRARKPSTKKLFEALKKKGVPPQNTAIMGDQIYTDVVCGKRAGVMTILIDPIELKSPLLLVRYWLELPFRTGGRGGKKKVQKIVEHSKYSK